MKRFLLFFLILLVLLRWWGLPNFTDDIDRDSLIKVINMGPDYLRRGLDYLCRKIPVTGPEDVLVLRWWGLPNFTDDIDRDSLIKAINRDLDYLRRIPQDNVYIYGPDRYTTVEIIDSMETFLNILEGSLDNKAFNKTIRSQFNIYRSTGGDGKGTVLFTGYYEPVLEGSLTKEGKYLFPLYSKPNDMIEIYLEEFKPKYKGERIIARLDNGKILPYFSRYEIDNKGVLRDKGLEIAWISDPVDIFFLQIQGSGEIRLENGQAIKVNYTASNGRSYKSIGHLLIDEGVIPKEEMSLKRLKEYLKDNPLERERILSYNESYIFFRIAEDGPLGNIEVPLTQGRSIATDSTLFPKGGLAFIITEKPVIDESGKIIEWRHLARFVLNQDTGEAIKGSGRVDLFFGKGNEAEIAASNMMHNGKLYFLMKKPS
ncbi:MAG: MltA domain-containing protein [Nitrospinae bacterium]|nr:MltA domain-containing protein [Nitrospinota bacterium]